jgi:predicted PurR-regulated permease PerM
MSKKLLDYLDFVDRTFMGFITGKLLDSAIVGLICYIFCAIVGMPYALLVSVIVGVTNIIPFFGPFIGAVPSAFIILMVSPIKCLVFVIFVIVLQQVDGNIIGPKILGSTVGINGFWVMFSIILGAGLFGFWGMLLGVPVFVVIYAAINGHVERKLKRSDLPWETAEYEDIDYIDPITYKPVMKQHEEEDEE